MSNDAPSKPFYLSKTFWVNIITLVAMAAPPAREFLEGNPETVVGVIAAVNVLLRFVTKGAVSLGKGGGRGPVSLLFFAGIVGMSLATLSLTSCAAMRDFGLGGEVYLRTEEGAKAGIRSDGQRHSFWGRYPTPAGTLRGEVDLSSK